MSRMIQELETLLEALTGDYQRLILLVEEQQTAMKKLDLQAMESTARQQETIRARLTSLENRRRAVAAQLTKLHGFNGTLRVEDVARLYPQNAAKLRKLRDGLKAVIEQLANRTQVSGRIAGAVLGHLNTVVRLIAGVVEKAGVYTRQGSPQLSGRIGMMDARG